MTSAAGRVGAGLLAARAARPIRAMERIHVVGAAGAGASAATLLAAHAGATVSGCDAGGPSPYTRALEALGIVVAPEHSASHVTRLPRPERLAVTKALTAVQPDHPELVAARDAGIPLEPWQQVVADAAVGRTLVGVAGTHGKSTTAGWLVHVLVAAGADPSAFVGALMPTSITGAAPATARRGEGDAFVVEADEYAGNFDPYRPAVAVLTSAEWDHPDVFADEAAVVDSFVAWLRRAPAGAVVVANVGDPGVESVLRGLRDWPGSIVAYALVDQSPQRLGGYARGIAERFVTASGPATALLGRVTASDPRSTTLELNGLDPLAGPIVTRLSTAGRHN
ncbi:MAG TPA: Mur ligase domain-containing protein, partial [Candidatus Limnocylindrales bacterium]